MSDGDSKTFALMSHEQVYGTYPDDQVEKLHCQPCAKMLWTALLNLKLQYRVQKLSDGKTNCGAGWLIDSEINSQSYYGNAIRSNKLMVKALYYTVFHQMRPHDITSAHQERLAVQVTMCAGHRD